MSLFDRYLFSRVDAVRPWLLQRLFLLLFAFDCWVDHASHAGRYGFGGFNVAHFRLLDALAPMPSPGLYVGTLLLAGLVAFAMAMTRPSRVGLATTCALYTYGWAMSMLDSYQHHYLLSIVLLAMVFFPRLTHDDVFPVASDRGTRVGGALLAFGAVELIVGLAGGTTPLGLFGPGSGLPTPAWIWMTRAALVLLGGLLAFLPQEKPRETVEPSRSTNDERSTTEGAAPASSSRKKKRGKKQSKLQTSPHESAIAAPRPVARLLVTPNTVAWGYVLLMVVVAIVYCWTAITKMTGDWREGQALRRLGQSELLLGLERQLTVDGIPLLETVEPATFWKLLGTGAILVQIVACVAYLSAPRIDRPGARRLGIALGLMSLAPFSFHLLAEVGLVLEIGWFSYYMILLSAVALLPARLLRVLAEGWSALGRELARRADLVPTPARAAVALAGLGLAGFTVDLPGARFACTLAALLALGGVAHALRHERPLAGGGLAGAAALAGIMLAISISQSEVRFDYYRFLGGEHRRHDQPAEALAAYEKANEHVLRPYCLYRGRDLVECYRSEARAQELAREHQLELRRRDRQDQAAQMRLLLEQGSSAP